METMTTPSGSPVAGSTRRFLTVGAVICLVLAATLGFALGSVWTGRHNTDTWHTGVAHTGTRQVSIEYDGWTYGANDGVPQWFDRQGTLHDSGWPACLRHSGRQMPVRFQAREVTVEGTTSRPIIAVDCRG